MYDTRTIFGSYIVTGNNAECLTGRFLPFPVFIHCHRFHPRNKLFVFHAYQIRSFIFTHYFERNQFVTRLIVFQRQFFRFLVKVSIKQSFRQHYGHLFPSISVVSLHSHIVYFRSYAQCRIRRQCPRSSGPCQEIRRSPFRHFGFRILHLELSYHSGVFHITVTARLVQLVRAQSCSGSRRVRLDGVAFIQQTFVIKLLQEPPQRFNIAVVISDIGILQIHPVTHLMSKVCPLFGKLHHVLTASCVVLGNRNGLSDILFGDMQCLFHTQFHRQSVSIPSGLTLYLEPFHGFIAAESIFNGTRHHVVNTRHTIGRGRSFIKHERRTSFTFCHTLGENIVFIPLLQHIFIDL